MEIFTPVVLTTVPTDWGPMHLAVARTGVVAAGMLATEEAFRRDLARRGYHDVIDLAAARPGPEADLADRAREAIGALLDGEDVDLATIPVEIGDRSAWDRLVLEGVRTIPWGTTAGYGEIARRIGRPRAARAVGGAVGRNPVGLLVPCHRVIAGDGSLGGYGAAAWGGVEAALELKRALLRLEGVEVARR
jgi:methylated-DNA-[protein]-cysteine S-methyltransferase